MTKHKMIASFIVVCVQFVSESAMIGPTQVTLTNTETGDTITIGVLTWGVYD